MLYAVWTLATLVITKLTTLAGLNTSTKVGPHPANLRLLSRRCEGLLWVEYGGSQSSGVPPLFEAEARQGRPRAELKDQGRDECGSVQRW